MTREGLGMAVDEGSLLAFCEERQERMKSPLTKAIYAGLADRIKRGFFAPEGDGDRD